RIGCADYDGFAISFETQFLNSMRIVRDDIYVLIVRILRHLHYTSYAICPLLNTSDLPVLIKRQHPEPTVKISVKIGIAHSIRVRVHRVKHPSYGRTAIEIIPVLQRGPGVVNPSDHGFAIFREAR